VSCDVTSPAVTVNAATSCIVTSPAVIVNSPSVLLGGSSGAMRFLADERIIAAFNNHTHNGSVVPDQQMALADICTTIVKGA
jgi:hypothetical protein